MIKPLNFFLLKTCVQGVHANTCKQPFIVLKINSNKIIRSTTKCNSVL